MSRRVPVGGLKCECCNKYRGKFKKQLARIVRRVLKQSDAKTNDNF
jgi:hypothetical protein